MSARSAGLPDDRSHAQDRSHAPVRRRRPSPEPSDPAATLDDCELRGARPRRRRIGLLRPHHRRARGVRAGQARARAGAPRPHRRQRVLRGRAGDRDRGPPLRGAPVPHVQPAGVGVRQPLHQLHRLPAPRVRPRRRPGLRVPDEPRVDQPVLRPRAHPRRGPRADRRAGRGDRDQGRRQPRGEGRLAHRTAAVRGVRQGLHGQAVADRPHRARRVDHHAAAGALHVRQPLLQRPLRGPSRRRLHRVAREDGGAPQHRGPRATSTTSTSATRSRRASPPSTPARSTATSTTPKARSRGARSTSSRRSSRPGISRAPRSSTTTTSTSPTRASSSSATSTPSASTRATRP